MPLMEIAFALWIMNIFATWGLSALVSWGFAYAIVVGAWATIIILAIGGDLLTERQRITRGGLGELAAKGLRSLGCLAFWLTAICAWPIAYLMLSAQGRYQSTLSIRA
jgi:hypothetical protein